MKRKGIITLFCFLLSIVVGLCVTGCSPDNSGVRLVLGEGKNITVDEENKTITTEARESASIPMAAVVDEEGNIQEEYVVTRTITDGDGNKKPSTLTMQHGEVYKVDYSATDGSKTLELSYTIKCFDTVLPTLTFVGLNRTYQIGQTVAIVPSGLPADLDYENSGIKLINKDTDAQTDVPFDGGYSFEAGVASSFKVVASLKDTVGNTNEITAEFNIVGAFEDSDVDPNCIWDFNEAGYLSNVIFASTSAVADTEIVTDGEVKALKLSLKAGETYELTFTKGKAVQIKNTSAINFTVRSAEVIDTFEVYNVDDGTYYDLSWRFGGYDGYTTLGFDPYGLYTEDYSLSAIKLKLMTEVDSEVFIDSIGYADVVAKWNDEDLPENAIAVFDDSGYMERVGAATSKDHTTFNGSAVFVSADDVDADIAQGFTGGGALKFTSNSDPSTTSDKQARDGFSFTFFERMTAIDFNMLAFKIYCEEPFVTLTVNFTDTKRGESNFIWVSLNPSAYVGQWATVVVPADAIANQLAGCENIVSMTVRFLRRAQTTEGAVVYLDKILNQSITFADFDYDFSGADDLDYYAVSSVRGATVSGIVADTNATDGFALKGITELDMNAASGMEIGFNDINIDDYLGIVMRLRTSDSVSILADETALVYGAYNAYTEVDLKALLKAKEISTLSSIIIGRKSVSGIEIYVDSIEFIPLPDYDNVDYDFSNADDRDITAALSYNGGTVTGIVADANAKDGFALKGVTGLNHSAPSGIEIYFDGIAVNDCLDMVLRLRTTNGVSIYANDTYLVFENYTAYTDVDLKALLKGKSIDSLTKLAIGRQSLGNIDIYVDSITFVKKSDINYDFSSATDKDLQAVSAFSGGTVAGIVADEKATGGFALKATTVAGGANGVKIRLSGIDLKEYRSVILRLRTVGDAVSIYANGTDNSLAYGQYADYTDVYVSDYMTGTTALDSVIIARNVANIEIYVDYIKLVKVDYSAVDYNFSSLDDVDADTVSTVNKGKVIGIVADQDATDGYALKGVASTNGAGIQSGIKITFDSLDLSKYSAIKVRIKTVHASGSQVQFMVNGIGASLKWSGYATYTEVDVLDLLKKSTNESYQAVTKLESIEITRDNAANIEVYVDYIKFEPIAEQ